MSNNNGTRDYFDKLNIIEQFCDGDTGTAKKILKGELNDILIFKGRFKDEDEYYFGLFLIFIHSISKTILNPYVIVAANASVINHKPYDDWRTFYSKIEKELNEAEVDQNQTETLTEVFQRTNELKLFNFLFSWTENNDIQSLTEAFKKIINKALKVKNSTIVIDFEYSTSLVLFEELGITPQ
jgi:hypothetical protein